MPIPKPNSEESEQEFVSRCIEQVFDEYGQEQGSAICYNTYRKERNMSTQRKVTSKLREESYRGINLLADLEKGPDDPCWESYVQVGTKIVDGREVPNCVPLED
jgi:hypothetical protein